MTRAQHDRAKLQGVAARQANRKPDANPYRNKPALRVLAEAWQSGWNETDRLHKREK